MNTTHNILEWNESEMKAFMTSVWLLCTVGFKYRVNPLTDVRKQFPQFKWEYIPHPSKMEQQLHIAQDDEAHIVNAQLAWELDDGSLFATLHDADTRFRKYSCNFLRITVEKTREGVHFFSREIDGELVLSEALHSIGIF